MVFALGRSSTRTTIILSFSVAALLYVLRATSLKHGGTAQLPAIKVWTSSASSKYALAPAYAPPPYSSVPGFEKTPPSCRVADLIDDPITREYGQNNVRLSRTYEGSGTRVRRVLQKALNGEEIKIAVVGGSVSTGHGTKWPKGPETFMYYRIANWFTQTFPHTIIEMNYDSVIAGTNAMYLSFCLSETIPDDADMVLVELDINHHDTSRESIEATEALLRSMLSMQKQPAVIYLSVFALFFKEMGHGWRQSALLTQWLDIPEINLRNFMIPHLMRHPEDVSAMFGKPPKQDLRHMNSLGHRTLADMLIAYLREQLCLLQRGGPVEQEASGAHLPSNDITDTLPRLGMLQKWSENGSLPISQPRCQSITSTKFPLKPVRADGWESYNRNDKRGWEATTPGSEISFHVDVHAGQLGIFAWSANDKTLGNAACWVDDDKRQHRIERITGYNRWRYWGGFQQFYLWDDMSAGPHIVTCKAERNAAEGGTVFRISGTLTR